jgi:nicotinamidase-related amidase
MRDANYVTAKDIGRKSAEWLQLAEGRCRAKNRFAFAPEKSALLVIDMQKFFTDSKSHAFVPASAAILPNIQALIAAYRKIGLPVIFTRHAFLPGEDPGILGKWWRDALRDGDEFAELDPRIEPSGGELVLRKNRYSAFANPNLEKTLRKREIGQLVISGVMTHLCCESTARDAFMRDFEVYFAVDATATEDEELHCATLQTLSNGFAVPVSTSEMLGKVGVRR